MRWNACHNHPMNQASLADGREGKPSVCGISRGCLSQFRFGYSGGKRGDFKYRSATRHRAESGHLPSRFPCLRHNDHTGILSAPVETADSIQYDQGAAALTPMHGSIVKKPT